MSKPFRLNSLLDPAASADPDDTLRTKTALKSLGHYEPPDWGLHDFPDQKMFDGIKAFQTKHGLRRDGVMRPEGETARALGRVLEETERRSKPNHTPMPAAGLLAAPAQRTAAPAGRGIAPGEWDWMHEQERQRHELENVPFGPDGYPYVFGTRSEVGRGRRNDPRDVLATRRALGWAGLLAPEKTTSDKADDDLFASVERFQRKAGLKPDGWLGPNGETAKALDKAATPKVQRYLEGKSDSNRMGDCGKAGRTLAFNPAGGHLWDLFDGPSNGDGPLACPADADALERTFGDWEKKNQNERRDIADPLPPVPPSEPSKEPLPDRTEFPAEPPFNIKDEIDKHVAERPELGELIETFPDSTGPLLGALILESRGNAETQELNNYCLDELIKEAREREWTKSVKHMSGAKSKDAGKLKERLRKPQGALRGVRADAQIKVEMNDGTERFDEFQSVDHRADGSHAPREAESNDVLRKHKELDQQAGDILSVLKNKKLPMAERKEECRKAVIAFAEKHYGPRRTKKER